MLEHHAHLVAADLRQLALGGLEQIAAFEQDAPGGRLDQPRQAAHERRLARARQPHDDEDLALADRESRLAHRADQPGPGEVGGRRALLVGGEEALGCRPEQLPYRLAGELDLGGHRRAPAACHGWSSARAASGPPAARAVAAPAPVAPRSPCGLVVGLRPRSCALPSTIRRASAAIRARSRGHQIADRGCRSCDPRGRHAGGRKMTGTLAGRSR